MAVEDTISILRGIKEKYEPQRIVNGDVPESLKNKKLLALDLGALLAGAKPFPNPLRAALLSAKSRAMAKVEQRLLMRVKDAIYFMKSTGEILASQTFDFTVEGGALETSLDPWPRGEFRQLGRGSKSPISASSPWAITPTSPSRPVRALRLVLATGRLHRRHQQLHVLQHGRRHGKENPPRSRSQLSLCLISSGYGGARSHKSPVRFARVGFM